MGLHVNIWSRTSSIYEIVIITLLICLTLLSLLLTNAC